LAVPAHTTPKRNRPADTASSDATSFAVMIGSRCGITAMPVPKTSVLVATAAAVNAKNGSSVR
jgi:hypothetical protein